MPEREGRPPHIETAQPTATVEEQQKAALLKLLAGEHGQGERELFAHQEDFVGRFIEYFKEVMAAREQGTDTPPRMARIEAAPRTGKTTIAAEIMRRSDMRGGFLVPTRNLIDQAVREFHTLLPDKKIAKYTGTEKDPLSSADVIVATYQIGQADVRRIGALPDALRAMPIVFADEGHESTTEKRMHVMREQFDPQTLRVALSGTPDYSETRRLEQFYPDLIHTLRTPEAVELGLLSPFQYWVFEINLDGSKVDVTGGDYNPADMGRLMSGLPVFKLMEQLRYHVQNRDVPALVCFRTKQQANDAAEYLRRIKPEGSGSIEAVTEDTPDRQKVLDAFDAGQVDTLLTVHVLLRGWDAPSCKLLLDFDPSLSPVRAGQKYTRPLTKTGPEDSRIARIYSVIPSRLRYQPLLPPDVLVEQDMEYPPGSVIGKVNPEKKIAPTQIVPLPERIENVKVTPLTSLREQGGLGAIKIERRDTALIRKIVISGFAAARDIESEEVWLTETLYAYRQFQNTFFSHEKFKGYGRVLLWALGIKNQEQFHEFVTEVFPDQRGTAILAHNSRTDHTMLHRASRLKAFQETAHESDSAREAQMLTENLHRKLDRDGLRQAIADAFLGPDKDETTKSPDEDDMILREAIADAIERLSTRERDVLFSNIIEEETFKGLGERHQKSVERERQILSKALRKLRRWLAPRITRSEGLIRELSRPEQPPEPLTEITETRPLSQKELLDMRAPLTPEERNSLQAGLHEHLSLRIFDRSSVKRSGQIPGRALNRETYTKARRILQERVSDFIAKLSLPQARYLYARFGEKDVAHIYKIMGQLGDQKVRETDALLEKQAENFKEQIPSLIPEKST